MTIYGCVNVKITMGCSASKLRKTHELFKCDIIPISQAYPCNETYDEDLEIQTILYKDERLLLFSDYECSSVSLVNSTTLTITDVVETDILESIYCVSSLDGSVYCVERDEDKIHRVRIKETKGKIKLTSKCIFLSTTRCYGIACFDGGFALLVDVGGHFGYPSRHIQCVTTNGRLKNQIYKKPDGGAVFTNPTHIASNYKQNILYVSDSNRVFVFDVNGDVLKCITLMELQPTYIASDPEGNFYVVCGPELLQFNPKYKKRVLLKVKESSNSRLIGAITWINPSRCLAVMQGDVLMVFKMAPAFIGTDNESIPRQWTPVLIGGEPSH